MTGPGEPSDPADPSVAVLTIVHGRHDHLVGMLRGLLAGSVTPDALVVVAMDDVEISRLVAEVVGDAVADVRVVEQPRVDGRLPLAAARNAATGSLTGASSSQNTSSRSGESRARRVSSSSSTALAGESTSP